MPQRDVFKRHGENTISHQLFYGLLSLFISIGLAGTAIAAQVAVQQKYQPGLFEGFLFCLVVPMLGAFMTFLNNGPWTSFIGYNTIVIPFGFVLGPLMKNYGSEYIVRDIYIQIILTTCITGCIGMYFPSILSNKKRFLFATIPGLLVILIIQFFFSVWEKINWIHIITTIPLSFYISYYFHQASVVSKTPRNSVDVTSRLYLDGITFFFDLLITSDPKQPKSSR